MHLNDSKTPLGAGRDLHENIGEGHIGRAGFEAMLAHPAFADVPLLLEVPGFKIDGAGKGPDKPNIDLVKEIRAQVAAAAQIADAPRRRKPPRRRSNGTRLGDADQRAVRNRHVVQLREQREERRHGARLLAVLAEDQRDLPARHRRVA